MKLDPSTGGRRQDGRYRQSVEGRRVPKERAQRDSVHPTADEARLCTLRRRVALSGEARRRSLHVPAALGPARGEGERRV